MIAHHQICLSVDTYIPLSFQFCFVYFVVNTLRQIKYFMAILYVSLPPTFYLNKVLGSKANLQFKIYVWLKKVMVNFKLLLKIYGSIEDIRLNFLVKIIFANDHPVYNLLVA